MRLTAIGFALCAVLFQPHAPAQVISVHPGEPRIGDRVEVRYDESAAGASLRGAATMRLEAMLMCLDDSPVLRETDMTREGGIWKGTIPIGIPAARLIVIRVVSGAEVDDNGGRPVTVLLFGEPGKPLEDSHRQNAAIMAGQGISEFKHIANLPGARAELAKERDLYPGNHRTWITQWALMRRETPGPEAQKAIQKDLPLYERQFKGNEAAMVSAVGWMDQVGLQGRADSIRNAWVKASPGGKMAEEVRRAEVARERDAARRAELAEKFLTDFPQTGPAAAAMEQILISSLVQSARSDRAIARLKSSPGRSAMLYNQVAWPLIEKGDQLETAVELAATGVAVARKTSPSDKPGPMRVSDWERQNAMSLGMILDTYALGLSKQGKDAEAAAAYREAFALLKGEDADVNQRYVECLLKLGRPADALAVSRESFINGKSSETLTERYREAFVKVTGSSGGFDVELAGATKQRDDTARVRIARSRLAKPAIDFTLKDLSGKPVQLAALRGKVVVIDFWATWCGPCRSSFPTLQKIYDRYRGNDRVAIFAVNTWERQTGAERQALVEKFMADNKYTFPVLYDEGFVERYGVDGIPTKFVVDKGGKIAFKTIGFNGPDEMMTEMTIQLDMLLEE